MEITLNDLPEGSSATVNSLHVGGTMQRRLFDFGIIEGTQIICLRYGSPSLYKVRGTMLALRKSDSAMICVEVCD